MKRLEATHNVFAGQPLSIYSKDALSENDILNFHDRFLTSGFHHIKVKNINEGREFINIFLKSLSVYHEIACLTITPPQLEECIVDIHHELLCNNYLTNHKDLEQFFLEDFYADFMWIEATKTLLNCAWFKDFEQQLSDLNIDQHIPMFKITYENAL